MPPKPSEKRTRVSRSEEENQSSVLAEDAMLWIQDVQMKLEKLKVLDKINERLSKIEYDIKDIKGNVEKLEEGLNSVNSDVAEIKQDLQKKAEREKLEELENEWKNYATDQGKTTLYSIMYRKKQKDKNVQILFKTL